MASVRLAEFIGLNRADLLDRCNKKATNTITPPRGSVPEARGIPLFLDHVVRELSHDTTGAAQMRADALQHGRDLFAEGFTIGELVHDYGAVCQSITDLAVETGVSIGADDFRTLNRCLDDAIASAVAEYAKQQRDPNSSNALRLRNVVVIAVTSFDALREGKVGISGATGDLLHRSLGVLSDIVNDKQLPGAAR